MLRFLTAGESHGPSILTILEGMPAGVPLEREAIDRDLKRRQGGYGRGRRMAIEADAVQLLSGVRHGVTLGTPIGLLILNQDWPNWQHTMSPDAVPSEDAGGARRPMVTRPRPGHADLAGAFKYGHEDLRNVLERASARETAARVAAGACARQFLAQLGVEIASHVTAIGPVPRGLPGTVPFEVVVAAAEGNPVRCADEALARQCMAAIDQAKASGDTLGGAFEVIVQGAPPGLGSYAQWDRRLDGRLGQAILSIPAVKAVEIGDGVASAFRAGSLVHDPIRPAAERSRPGAVPGMPARPSNRAGGLEGGVTNGEEIRLTGFMKPIATLMSPLPSVDLRTGVDAPAAIERSDTCAVPAAAVIGEAVVALVLADAFTEKFGSDSLREIAQNYARWRDTAARITRE